jgi:transcriptional repressor NrdR
VSTIEQVEEAPLKVVKKDRSREPFDTAKLRRSLELACNKRPISADQIEAIVQQIEAYICARYFNEVPSTELGELVMEQLRRIDQVAYVRYASVYREFKDVSDFVQEVEPMLTKGPNGARQRRSKKPDEGAVR